MDLPTYTNIWRIEKRLYKLYDFRLPAPLPITWIGVFVGIVAIFFLFTREITRFVQFIVLAVAIAVIFYTPGIVHTLATGIANALGVH